MTNAQFAKWNPSDGDLDRTWSEAWADMLKAREEKQRAIDAMLRAGLTRPEPRREPQ
jgi:hypothetical protein